MTLAGAPTTMKAFKYQLQRGDHSLLAKAALRLGRSKCTQQNLQANNTLRQAVLKLLTVACVS